MAHPLSGVTQNIVPIYDHLLGHHHQSNVEQPQLATDWSVTPDGKTWTFNLRDDVPFYRNGKPLFFTFGAQDVVLAFNLLTGNFSDLTRFPGGWADRLGTNQSAWIVESPHKLRLELPRINLDIPFQLSDEWASGIPSKFWWGFIGGEQAYMADPVGTGPWSLLDFSPNDRILHERVEDHWRKTPEFHELEFLFVNDEFTRLGMLIAGETAIAGVSRSLLASSKDSGIVSVRGTTTSVHQGIGFIFYREFAYCSDGTPPPGGAPCGRSGGWDIEVNPGQL